MVPRLQLHPDPLQQQIVDHQVSRAIIAVIVAVMHQVQRVQVQIPQVVALLLNPVSHFAQLMEKLYPHVLVIVLNNVFLNSLLCAFQCHNRIVLMKDLLMNGVQYHPLHHLIVPTHKVAIHQAVPIPQVEPHQLNHVIKYALNPVQLHLVLVVKQINALMECYANKLHNKHVKNQAVWDFNGVHQYHLPVHRLIVAAHKVAIHQVVPIPQVELHQFNHVINYALDLHLVLVVKHINAINQEQDAHNIHNQHVKL